MKRRDFIKTGALLVPAIFIPRLIRAQSILTADGLAAFGTNAPAGGGGGGGTSYANKGGTGNRTAFIAIVANGSGAIPGSPKWVDGDTTSTGQFFISGIALDANSWVYFDFGSGQSAVIDEAKFYQQDASTQGTWKWQGSNDASGWTDIGSSFALGGVATQTITALSGNTTGYRYYRLIGVSGTSNGGPWTFEMEFKISGVT